MLMPSPRDRLSQRGRPSTAQELCDWMNALARQVGTYSKPDPTDWPNAYQVFFHVVDAHNPDTILLVHKHKKDVPVAITPLG